MLFYLNPHHLPTLQTEMVSRVISRLSLSNAVGYDDGETTGFVHVELEGMRGLSYTGHIRHPPGDLIVIVSQTCKQLQRTADEHQIWLHQARRLEVPIPPGTTPSKTELRHWVISRTRVDFCWIKRCPADLVLCSFELDVEFLDANFIPGGEFIVILYDNGDVGLNKIEVLEVPGRRRLDLREVARYKEPDKGNYPDCWSALLTETSYRCPCLYGWGPSTGKGELHQ